jgi:tetratricopeptide (TPR) repeat protein
MKKAVLLIILILSFNKIVFSAATSDQYLAAGNTLYQQKDYQKAVLYYKAAVQVDPGNALAYQRLGNTYYLLGQKQDALTAYQHALAINPNNPQLSNFVQALQAQLGSGSPMAPAAPKRSYEPVKDFELNVGLGVADGGYGSSLGIGGTASGYFKIDKNLWLGGSLGVYDFSYSSVSTAPNYTYGFNYVGTSTYTYNDSLIAIELLASGKYYFDGQGLKPYLVAGVGLSMLGLSESDTTANTYPSPYTGSDNSTTTSISASAINPMLQGGAGLLLTLAPGLDLFGEVKYSLVISSGGSGSYIPINAGLSFNF